MDLRGAVELAGLAGLLVALTALARAASRRLPAAALRPGEPYAEPTPRQRLLALAVVGGCLLALSNLVRHIDEEPLWLVAAALPSGLALGIWWLGFGVESAHAFRRRPRPWALLLVIQIGVLLGLCWQRGPG